ncbi:hypothetical protein GGX14DRAFT_511320 [Mycena pura]|uniref:Rab-GAP TBC domain-containing protein n=1 Tax=Mycena pura TaxID=153505 RepID=A0AAD6YP20_9AGAR|nr:hypothetical protein GGX14DRAFT_511320 [Mycena pura]
MLHESSYPTLDLDDAFADAEDDETHYKFSPDVIREDIARHELSLAYVETEVSLESEHPLPPGFVEPDESVSTLDINGTSPPSPSSIPLETSLDDEEDQFSQISLSESTAAAEEPTDDTPISNDHPYPDVIIDVSKYQTHRVTASSTSELENSSCRSHSPPRPASGQSSQSEIPDSSVPSDASSDPLPSSQSLPPPSIPPPQNTNHRPARSSGPSALEKVRSKTRPSFLPPKSRQEDDKHLTEWEAMMKLSRAAAEKRRRTLQDRRLAREKKIEDSLQIWEKEIVPDWKVVHKNPALRKLWWQGIPTKLRAPMWANAVGNALALNKDNYRTCLTRAKRAMGAGTFPSATLSLIEQDISTTLPSLHIFHHETGPLYPDLKDMLCAWVVSRSDEGLGYTVGASKIAAMLLINMPAQQAFIVMRNLMERHCMRSFYGGEGSKDDVDAYYRIFDTLLADGMPKSKYPIRLRCSEFYDFRVYFNFKQHQISPASYLPEWLIPLFLDHLPFEACARVWDILVLEGDSFLYRAALGILAVLEPRLFFPDRTELLELLRGENKAALDVARREGGPLDGGKYEIYGVDEETLWDRIDSMHDWWKDSTWLRLIQRELPDL